MDTRTAAFLVCAAMAWSAVVYKAAALRHDPKNVRLWALVATIALPSAGFTLAITAVYNAVSRLSGIPNLATLLVYGSIVGYSVSALVMLLLWEHPTPKALPRAKALVALYIGVLLTMIALFFAINAPDDHPTDFDTIYGAQSVGGTFLLVYVAAFAFGLISEIRLAWQFAGRVAQTGERPWMRRGLRLTTIGSLVTMGYCLGKAAFVLLAWFGDTIPILGDLGVLCACLGCLVMTTGFTMPSWGPRLSAAAEWRRDLRTFQQLRPLWEFCYEHFPSIALDPAASPRAGLRDIDYRLYRRIVEISDGLLALEPFLQPVHAPADDLATRFRLPAEDVLLALQLREAGARLSPEQAPPASSSTEVAHIDTDDRAVLVRISNALRRLPTPPNPNPHSDNATAPTG